MKKYDMAWIYNPANMPRVMLGSSDPALIKWFLDELTKIAPGYHIRDDYSETGRDLDGNMTVCSVDRLDNKDRQINFWLLQKLLEMDWEPFNIEHENSHLYFRRETIS